MSKSPLSTSSSYASASSSQPVIMVVWLSTSVSALRCASVKSSQNTTGTDSMPSSCAALHLAWPATISARPSWSCQAITGFLNPNSRMEFFTASSCSSVCFLALPS